ncbi:MAG: response regulator [Azoarcus sp.]|jgi:two-component system chemotaxis response regulator CheY|nr:response regulator [Azoarcus sp.]
MATSPLPERLDVLLVEPSAMQAQLTLNMLAKLGVRGVRHVAGGREGLTAMRRAPPDAAISSLYLPDMTGTALVAAMRADPALEWTPFILVSSETRPQVLDPVRQSGACCVIAKPFTVEQMRRALDAAIERPGDAPPLDAEEVEHLKALVVDDSATSRHYVRHLLEEMGIAHIIEAENGRQAMSILAETMVDCVLTDYNMPEMDGRALVEYIRTQSWQSEVPILMLTSENNRGRLAAVEKAGVSAICDKPFERGSIRALILRALRQ